MTNPQPKCWRLRFSIRTLAIVVTLVCCYAACWGPTKTWGVHDVHYLLENDGSRSFGIGVSPPNGILDVSAHFPLLVRLETLKRDGPGTTYRYYFWFLGFVVQLPTVAVVALITAGLVAFFFFSAARN